MAPVIARGSPRNSYLDTYTHNAQTLRRPKEAAIAAFQYGLSVKILLRTMALEISDGFDTGNVNNNTDASLPIFNVERVQLQFSIAADFVAAQVANNVLILALATGRILRIDLDNPADIDGTTSSTFGTPKISS